MERKKAADFPPEVLRLFDGYVHGTRREFLDRAAKFAVGGISAAAMLQSLAPDFAWPLRSSRGHAHSRCSARTSGKDAESIRPRP